MKSQRVGQDWVLILPLFFHPLTQIWNSKVSKNLLTESVGFTFSFTNGGGVVQRWGLQQREGRVCGQTTKLPASSLWSPWAAYIPDQWSELLKDKFADEHHLPCPFEPGTVVDSTGTSPRILSSTFLMHWLNFSSSSVHVCHSFLTRAMTCMSGYEFCFHHLELNLEWVS